MNIDLGWLGKVVLEECKHVQTESGIRVHGVVDDDQFNVYPTTWNNAILLKL